MAPRQSKTNLLPGVCAQHPTVGPQVSHFLNHRPVSGFYLLTYEIQIGALYLGVRAPCVSFMSCRRDVVWHYPSDVWTSRTQGSLSELSGSSHVWTCRTRGSLSEVSGSSDVELFRRYVWTSHTRGSLSELSA